MGEVGGQLDQERHGRRGGPNHVEQLAKPLRVLEVAQAGGVRRADIDREVVGHLGHRARRGGIVVDLAVAVAADVDPDDEPLRQPRTSLGDPPGEGLGAGVVEPHAVDERAVARQPEEPRARIARLRPGRDRPELDEAEPERRPALDGEAVLVEARAKADTVAESQAHELDGLAAHGRRAANPQSARPTACRPDQPSAASVA